MTQNEKTASGNLFDEIRRRILDDETKESIEEFLKSGYEISQEKERQALEAVKSLSEPLPGVAWIVSKMDAMASLVNLIWGRFHTIVIIQPEKKGMFVASTNSAVIDVLRDYYAENMQSAAFTASESTGYGFFESSVPVIKETLLSLILGRSVLYGSPVLKEKEILITQLKKLTQPISQHIFLFPFIPSEYDKNSPIDIRELTQRLFDELVANSDWRYEPFKIFECRLNQSKTMDPSAECCLNYDEYSYFHEYTRKALFNTNSYDEKSIKNFTADSDAVSSFFQYTLPGPSTFQIDISRYENGELTGHLYPYRLAIRGITLRLFKTGVAILGIELHNFCYNRFEDIQKINDYGRRVYPQFMEEPSLSIPKGKFLADAVTIDVQGREPIKETFDLEYFRLKDYERLLNIGRHITGLLGKSLCDELYVQPIIDDRMFTLCWYADQDLIDKLTRKLPSPSRTFSKRRGVVSTGSEADYPFRADKKWYSYIFIDGNGCGCQDEQMRKEQIAASTYRRWNDWGTLYGISRYSLMCLTTPGAPSFMREHMRRHYRQMAELLLAQRASIIVFSNRISRLSGQIDDLKSKDVTTLSKDIRKIHGDYLGFVNRLWFDEVTPQEQGIEIYDIAVQNMRLKEQMQELKAEIKELYEFMEMQESNAMNRTMLNLTRMASIGIPVTVVLAFWGISTDFVEIIDSSQPFAFAQIQGWKWVAGTLFIAMVIGIGIAFKDAIIGKFKMPKEGK